MSNADRENALPSDVSAPCVEAAPDAQITELRELTRSLMVAVQAIEMQRTRGLELRAAIDDVKAATRAMLVAPAQISDPVAPREGECRGCGCGPCECVSCACCTFEVWMSHVRVDQMQNPIDIADSNLLPTSMMEVWMFASIDALNKIGVCIPDASPTSYKPLHKQITDPFGPWEDVNRCVGTATVKKGVPLTVALSLTAVERENALERLKPGNRDEWGSATENLTLDCCYSTYSPILIPVALTSWGQAGGVITGRFIVVKRC